MNTRRRMSRHPHRICSEYGSYDGDAPCYQRTGAELDAASFDRLCVLHEDNMESMVFDPQEIMDHGGLFGVDHEEWEKSPPVPRKGRRGASGTSAGTRTGISLSEQIACHLSGKP